MPAQPQSRLKPDIKKLGIIAGEGALPGLLLDSCDRMGIETFIVAFDRHTPASLYQGRKHILSRPGAAGKIIRVLKDNDIQDIVMIGAVKRPGLSGLRPDLYTVSFLIRSGWKALGDNGLLTAIRTQLEQEGFRLHGLQDFVQDILMSSGPLGTIIPDAQDEADIQKGIEASQALGALDIGQSVIVADGTVLGVEAVEGTNDLIRRCVFYKEPGSRSGVLVKTCKPQQDRDLDLPTIGPDTIKLCAESGIKGIAVQARQAFLVHADEVCTLADQHGLFVTGIEIHGRHDG